MASQSPSVALVLGSGGILGSSFHAGVLLALAEVWGLDARSVDEVLGTSAGAVTGAFVAAGISPADLLRREQGRELTPEGSEIMDRRPQRSKPQTRPAVSVPGFAASPMLGWNAVRSPGEVMPGTVFGGLLPRGRSSTKSLAATVDAMLADAWPSQPRFRVAAVRLANGKRHVFSETDHVAPGQAVAAACSVPAIHRPVRVGADEFIDGAVHSANNLDVVSACDVIIVSSPSTVSDWKSAADPLAAGRIGAGMQLRAEMRRLNPESRVVVVEPDHAVLAAMGTDIMFTGNRAAVSVAAHQLATRTLRSIDSPFNATNSTKPASTKPASTKPASTSVNRGKK